MDGYPWRNVHIHAGNREILSTLQATNATMSTASRVRLVRIAQLISNIRNSESSSRKHTELVLSPAAALVAYLHGTARSLRQIILVS